ncbi:hypothetical protein [Nannocystis pusilla]|uniref:FHA domain-containing protein n=1 Tax=Nannocystis pusilla TaxID=889268 RepID=A0ABS7U511_9BACT|nr:hypothetical protein [Nannocystis pusilla]MBZ5715366.1 hypothetical protein [Nannocystis pusilla]
MDAAPPDTPPDDLWLVVDELHPALRRGGLDVGARWPVPLASRLTVGLRALDSIRLPHARDALLGGQTAYVLVRRDAPRVEVQHTGHIGHFRLGGRLHNAAQPPPALAPGDSVELLTVEGELGLRLRLAAELT